MPTSLPPELAPLHGKPCKVTTHDGKSLCEGTIMVTRFALGSGVRVDVHFETERMACAIGIGPERLQALRDSWNGESFHFALPTGGDVWLGQSPQRASEGEGLAI